MQTVPDGSPAVNTVNTVYHLPDLKTKHDKMMRSASVLSHHTGVKVGYPALARVTSNFSKYCCPVPLLTLWQVDVIYSEFSHYSYAGKISITINNMMGFTVAKLTSSVYVAVFVTRDMSLRPSRLNS